MRIDEVAPSRMDIDKVVGEFREFLKICMEVLALEKLPKIQWISDGSHTTNHQSFGSFHIDDQMIQVEIENRHPIDIMRTLAHELVHYKQSVDGRLKPNSGETGSPEENEAHIKAGIIMRQFDKRNPEAFQFNAIFENISKDSMKLLQKNAGFYHIEQAADAFRHGLYYEKNYNGLNPNSSETRKKVFNNISKKWNYYQTLKIKENFADGKGPGKPGDSARHGIPKGATIAQLEKAAKAKGRKGQLARWQLNMRRGKKK